MVEIRPAQPEEVARQKLLWKLAFGDTDAYIDHFFANGEKSQMLVLLEDGVIWTMVALFPVRIALPDGESASSAYIYALATHPEARKKGFGRHILNYVDFYLKEQGINCVTIVPAEVSLHKYFGTVGFTECFATRKVELLRDMVGTCGEGDTLECISPQAYNRVRQSLLAGHFHVAYSDGLVDYQRSLSELDSGGLFHLVAGGAEGVAAAEYLNSDTVLVKELLIDAPCMPAAAALLAREMPAARYHLRTPPFWDGVSGSYLQSFAMIKWYDADLERQWREYRRGYMGLGFD